MFGGNLSFQFYQGQYIPTSRKAVSFLTTLLSTYLIYLCIFYEKLANKKPSAGVKKYLGEVKTKLFNVTRLKKRTPKSNFKVASLLFLFYLMLFFTVITHLCFSRFKLDVDLIKTKKLSLQTTLLILGILWSFISSCIRPKNTCTQSIQYPKVS